VVQPQATPKISEMLPTPMGFNSRKKKLWQSYWLKQPNWVYSAVWQGYTMIVGPLVDPYECWCAWVRVPPPSALAASSSLVESKFSCWITEAAPAWGI
jgi:hypothetical protein